MNPEALGYIVGSVIGIGLCIGLLVVICKVMKSLARTLKPLTVVAGLILFGVIGTQLVQGKLSPQQKDQIAKFFDSLVDQARGAFSSEAQSDDVTPSPEPVTGQTGTVIMTGEVPSGLCNARIDLGSCVKE